MTDIYARLESLESLGIKFGLENIRRILDALGNPEQRYPAVLIAGTNGKGSVGAMLEAILVKNGFRTGYYLSPHLVDVRERIRINAKIISRNEFENSLSKVFEILDHLSIPATYFEALTAAAFLEFASMSIDFAVVEVGLGGRFDATNVIRQTLSIITSIGIDHEAFLGNTVESIAIEKAMISKPGIPMVIGNLHPDAKRAVESVCSNLANPLYSVEPSNIVDPKLLDGFPSFYYQPWATRIRVNLRGRHQIDNASIVLLALDQLQNMGFSFERQRVLSALNEVRWPGRLDQVPGFVPPLLLDCAHNPMGARTLCNYLNEQGWARSLFLFTAMKDKNVDEMLQVIKPRAQQLMLCRIEPLDRCATKDQLISSASKTGILWEYVDDLTGALDAALSLSKQVELPLVAFGSIYLIGSIFSKLGLTT